MGGRGGELVCLGKVPRGAIVSNRFQVGGAYLIEGASRAVGKIEAPVVEYHYLIPRVSQDHDPDLAVAREERGGPVRIGSGLNCGESDPLRIEIGHGMTAYTCRRKAEKFFEHCFPLS